MFCAGALTGEAMFRGQLLPRHLAPRAVAFAVGSSCDCRPSVVPCNFMGIPVWVIAGGGKMGLGFSLRRELSALATGSWYHSDVKWPHWTFAATVPPDSQLWATDSPPSFSHMLSGI